jgi:iron complex outermembrane receptor protein
MAGFAGQLAGALGLPAPQTAAIAGALAALRPSATQVRGVLRNLGAAGSPIVPWTNPQNLAPLSANFSNTWELGYKGVIKNNLRVAVDFWYQIRPADPTTQIVNLDDAVFLDPTTLGSYLGAAMGPTIGAQLLSVGLPPANVAAQTQAIITGWVTNLAQIPGGVLNFDSPLYDKNYLVFTYQNATGQIDVRGIDIAVDYLFNDVYSIAATYSNLNRNVWTNAPGATAANPLTANAAKNRGTVTLRYDNQARGMTGELRTRYTGGFPAATGVYNSYNQSTPIPYDEVPANLFIDAGFSVSVPWLQNTRWAVNAQNLLDNRVNSYIGVPEVGRMITTRLSYTF